MADKFIDLDETQFYGAHAARTMRSHVAGLVPEFKKGIEKLADEVEHATAEVKAALDASRRAGAEVRRQSQAKGPVLGEALQLLGRFSRHLDAQPRGSVDRRSFFPEDGTAAGVGRSAPRVLLALGRIQTQLKASGCELRDRDEWRKEVGELAQTLAPLVEHSHSARTERAAITPELEAQRQAWLQTYLAAKCGVECVLRLSGAMHLLSAVFHDLAVPGSAKITEPPPPVPPEPAAPTP